jgi:predicted aspartyl protease
MATRYLAALLLASATASCAAGGGTPAAQSQACTIERTAELPVRLIQGQIFVPASINHTPVQLLVDTGASTSMLTPEAATTLRLPSDPHRSTTVHGTGGNILTRNVLVQSFEIGDEDRLAGSVTTGRLGRSYNEDPLVAGLLGADYLTYTDVELDVPHGRMTLWRVQHCAGDSLTWQVPHYAIPLMHFQPNRMVLHVQIDQHPVTALIDWGARSTMITTATAAALGVTPAMLAHDPSGTAHGVDQNDLPFHVHRFAELLIGPATFRNVALQVADLNVSDVGMLLGTDYFQTRHVWLSYATEQMFVERRLSPVPTASR